MILNVVARNQEDHPRNIAFLMDKDGKWTLSPAFDLIWAYNINSQWTNLHQMSINGKREGITREDLTTVARQYGIRKATRVIREVTVTVLRWPTYAEKAGISDERTDYVAKTHRTDI